MNISEILIRNKKVIDSELKRFLPRKINAKWLNIKVWSHAVDQNYFTLLRSVPTDCWYHVDLPVASFEAHNYWKPPEERKKAPAMAKGLKFNDLSLIAYGREGNGQEKNGLPQIYLRRLEIYDLRV